MQQRSRTDRSERPAAGGIVGTLLAVVVAANPGIDDRVGEAAIDRGVSGVVRRELPPAFVLPPVITLGYHAATLGGVPPTLVAAWVSQPRALPYGADDLMSSHDPDALRHVIAALVTNEPGVLAQVAGMFAARGFNIDSLVVGRTENPELSRMTIVVNGNEATLEQVRKQLQKLVPVVKVVAYKDTAFVERDLCLVQVSTPTAEGKSSRSEIIELVNLFRARIVDVAPEQVMIEISGTEAKIEAFIALVAPYGIVELARTGVIAMPRGNPNAAITMSRPLARAGGTPDAGPRPDVGDLPPG